MTLRSHSQNSCLGLTLRKLYFVSRNYQTLFLQSYTGKHKLVDTGGRVDKFNKRFRKPSSKAKSEESPVVEEAAAETPVVEEAAAENFFISGLISIVI